MNFILHIFLSLFAIFPTNISDFAPLEAKSFLAKQGDNIIEIASKADSKFIKYDLQTRKTLRQMQIDTPLSGGRIF